MGNHLAAIGGEEPDTFRFIHFEDERLTPLFLSVYFDIYSIAYILSRYKKVNNLLIISECVFVALK